MSAFANANIIFFIILFLAFLFAFYKYFKLLKKRNDIKVYLKERKKIDFQASAWLCFISSFFIFVEIYSKLFDVDLLKNDFWFYILFQVLLLLGVTGLNYLFKEESEKILENNLLNNSPTVEFTKSKVDVKNKVNK